MNTRRVALAVTVGVIVAAAAGCGSKASQHEPSDRVKADAKESSAGQPGSKAEPPKAETAKSQKEPPEVRDNSAKGYPPVSAQGEGPATAQDKQNTRGDVTPPAFEVVDGPRTDEQGLISWTITSPYQKGPNPVQVLCPDQVKKGTRLRVIYVLPVNPGINSGWGSGIVEAKRLDLHNKYGVMFVCPAFERGPNYGDHPTDPTWRHESHIVNAVVPFIEQHYPVLAEPRGRLLLGFSMSGCGALSLLLQHPDVFGRIASWDAPRHWRWWPPDPGQLQSTRPWQPDALLDQRAEMLKTGGSRIALLGYDCYRADAESTHKKLLSLGIPHDYSNDKYHRHCWGSGWFAPAVEILLK
ncbi:MAG TPA: alpha/beta hydrolase-fold protein [Planctomycetota bacterium]|nr:alpha/beta hydrolase-fold protein [Phycisphaerae bacterium]HUW57706.1 alpha/beta hydrolase-fold protein [Planctomycetota bacterium]